MAEKDKPGPLKFLLVLAIVLLVLYCVSLSVFFVYFIREYSLLQQSVQDLRSRVVSLEERRVTTRATVSPSGNLKTRVNKEPNLGGAQQVSCYSENSFYVIRRSEMSC